MAKTLTPKERKDMIRTLKGAANLIESGKKNFICTAISQYAGDNDINWGIAAYLRVWIGDMLGYGFVPSIGKEVKIITLEAWNGYTKSNVAMKQDRLHWIDWMINELKSEKA